MPTIERDVMLGGKDKGNQTIDYPYTRLRNLSVDDIDEGENLLTALADGQYLPVYDSTYGGFRVALISAVANYFAKRNVEKFTLTLASNSWSNKAQTISNDKIVKADNVFLVFPVSASKNAVLTSELAVSDVSVNGKMSFSVKNVPTSAITVQVLRIESKDSNGEVFGSLGDILNDTGVTAGSYGAVSDTTSGSFKVPSIKVDAKGRITEISDKTVTLPSVPNVTKTSIANITIPASGWVSEANNGYAYRLDVTVTGMTASMNPYVALNVASQNQAALCGLCSTVESLDGKLCFRTKTVPTAAMTGILYILGTVV